MRATDHGSPRRSSTVRASIHVMGVQGGASSTLAPPPAVTAQVTELDPVGYLVAVVQPPVVDSALVWFTIVGKVYNLRNYVFSYLNVSCFSVGSTPPQRVADNLSNSCGRPGIEPANV